MINVRYFASACVGLKSPELSILCDPWFTPGAYDGAWELWPTPPADIISIIGRYEFIYVSHLHPDHYDPVFLRRYLMKYPDTRIIIADFKHNYLSKMMTRDKVPHEIRTILSLGLTDVRLIPQGDGANDFDSVLVMTYRRHEHSVINWNDAFYDERLISKVLEIAGPNPSIALLPFTGAGPYPQTYYTDEKDLAVHSARQKEAFFSRYMRLAMALKAKVRIPFAGQYLLRGKLADLNQWRGVADAVEVLAIDPSAVVLQDFGKGEINTAELKAKRPRKMRYLKEDLALRIQQIKEIKLDHEIFFKDLPLEQIPFQRLLMLSFQNALKKSEQIEPYKISINYGAAFPYVMHIGKEESDECTLSEITIDPKLLFGLLTGVFHWNNAETGSLYRVKRTGHYSRPAQDFLNFFHI